MSGDVYRLRLEGRAELLEATRLRYRALIPMLAGFRWRDRLRRNAALLREVIARQPELEAALGAAQRRAAAEGWPARSSTVRCLWEVESLARELCRLAAKRAGGDETLGLGALLERVEAMAVLAPRLILPGQRWAAALEALPPTLPGLKRAAWFGELLERCFQRPYEHGGPMPLTPAEAKELERAWPGGEEALAGLWERLASVDVTGSLGRQLQRRARRAPVRPPGSGPELLLHAEFWRGVAWARLREAAASRLSPLEPDDGELVPVIGWLCAREEGVEEPLALSAERAALFELAYELWRGSEDWPRLLALGRRVDGARETPGAARLREELQLLLRVQGGRVAKGAELVALLEELRRRRTPAYPPRTLGKSTSR